jgi:hydrogenase/urease accessory protein HupE
MTPPLRVQHYVGLAERSLPNSAESCSLDAVRSPLLALRAPGDNARHSEARRASKGEPPFDNDRRGHDDRKMAFIFFASISRSPRTIAFAAAAMFLLARANLAGAHPIVENAIDVVVSPERIVVEARISSEELFVVATTGGVSPTDEQLQKTIETHGDYVLNHLRIQADGQILQGTAKWIADDKATQAGADDASGPLMYVYRLEYPLGERPKEVQISQDFLKEFPPWTAPCELRVRQSDRSEFQASLLKRRKTATLDCEWTAEAQAVSAASIHTEVQPWPTFCAYMAHGIEHILTGYDHLLFVTALVLAATSLWDLLKVVTAFTIAHSLTLVLSVFNIVHLSEHVVEPMIAASIVFVAVQNIFWPERSTGRARLAVAFGFGLFHGLGFAGGLMDAMSEMPNVAVWLALVGFSLGVEIGHQIVVIPSFTILQLMKNWRAERPRLMLMNRVRQIGSCGIAIAGIYYLVTALT